ncbi:SpaA isopeptide-forming pilin-related protein [Bhargavaea beijingensis]|uniref:LPXTG cell wall anchor domain-containing protein n=1 Tax=Bhargavaea beijingensis TaxID=426756 RepID=A0ABX9ZDM2_9BACL|nr:SpaA isopeptide-forming pilin-related protein [Bhargavaea beijingensis]RSK33708.1 LPXTG cell wall anchor domain-containing protein [Bhargavaea beijingensis]
MRKRLSMIALIILLVGQTLMGSAVYATVEIQPDAAHEVLGEEPATAEEGGTGTEADSPQENVEAPPAGGEQEDPPSQEAPGETSTKPAEPEQENTGSEDTGTGKVDEESSQPKKDSTPKASETPETPETEDDATGEEAEKDVMEINSDLDMVVDPSVISQILFTLNGKPVSGSADVKDGDTATLRFEIKLDSDHNYGKGSTLTYELPSIFSGMNLSGKLGDIGTFSADGNQVTITFNEEIRDGLGNALPVEDAFFEVGATLSAVDNQWTEEIQLPGNDTITLNFLPKGGSFIEKKGTADNGGKNSDSIDWEVKVNTNLGHTSDQISFKDTLTDGHQVVPESVKVFKLNVHPDGSQTVGEAVSVQPDFTETGMTFNLPNTPKQAYQIMYKTEITDPGDEARKAFANTADANGKTVTESVDVQYGTPLAKSGSVNKADQSATWKIQYNMNNRPITNPELTDSWTTTGGGGEGAHEFVDGSLVVYEADGKTIVDASRYTVTLNDDRRGFSLKFKKPIREGYVIEYRTKPENHFITDTVTVKNTVTRVDNDKKADASVSFGKKDYILNKGNKGPNYADKTIEWWIQANQSGYTLKEGTVFEDRFAGENLTLIEESLVVKVGGKMLEKGTDYTLNNLGKKGFDIKLLKEVNGVVDIAYTTEYDIKDIGANNRTYKNVITITDSGLPGDPTADSTVNIRQEQKDSGYKTGLYDYETKTFHWEVVMNYNLNDLKNAVFEDTLPESQEVGEIYVQPVNVLPNGQLELAGGAVLMENKSDAPHKIKLSLGDIDQAYHVSYTSKDKDGVYPETAGDVKITNKASLSSDAGPHGEWSKTVTVKHTEKVIEKTGKGLSNTERIAWNFKLNYSQSKLSDVVITDTVGKDADGQPDQLYLEDTFKVSEMKMTGRHANGEPKMEKVEVDPSRYTLSVNIKDGTFTLKFNETIEEAYLIEYETIFLGKPGSDVKNEVNVSYFGTEATSGSDKSTIKDYWYNSGGSTVKVPFKVIKTDKETKEPIEGVTFTLYNQNHPSRPLISGSTDENGIWDIGIKLAGGKYVLKETKPAPGYANPADLEFTLHVDSVESKGEHKGYQLVSVVNEKLNHSFKVRKVDQNQQPLEGAVFELQTADGTTVEGYERLISDKDGWVAVHESIEPGDYQLVEIEAPKGYVLLEKPVKFTIDDQQTAQKVLEPIKNEVAPGATLKKYHQNPDGKLDQKRPLQGAEFHLYKKDGESLQRVNDDEGNAVVYVTDETGEFYADNLQKGEYAFIEVKAPEGYALDETPIPFKLPAENGQPIILEVGNQLLVPLKVEKTDAETGNPIPGVEFGIYDRQDLEKPLLTGTTDESGLWIIETLPEGDYTLKELKPADGYADHEDIEFLLAEGDVEAGFKFISVTNKKLVHTFKVQKVDQLGNPLAGVAFELQTENGETVEGYERLVSDEDGWIILDENIKPGNYQLVETEALKGYQSLAEPITFTIDDQQTAQKVLDPIVNEVIPGAFLEKYHANANGELDRDRPLEGAQFNLYKQDSEGNFQLMKDAEGQAVVYETDEKGELFTGSLEKGIYQFVEAEAPEGYLLDKTPIGFSIPSKDGKPFTLEFGNQLLVPLKVEKTDAETGNPIPGVEFGIYDREDLDKPLLTGKTDESGLWIIETLPEGDYTLREIKPADGYADHEDIEFTLAEGAVEAEGDHAGFKFISVTNKKLVHTFKVQKVDQLGKPLPGVAFELQTENGETVEGYERLVSDEDGWIIVDENIKPGNYQLVEIETLKGYQPLEQPIPFTIDDQQTEQKVLDPIVNEVIPGAYLKKFHKDSEGKLDRDRPLEGAHFNLYKQHGEGNFQLVKDDKGEAVVYVTDETGELFTGGLEKGTYQFVEAEAPEGYLLDKTPIGFSIPSKDGKPFTLEFGNQLLVPLKVEKTDAETGNPIPGVEFGIFDRKDLEKPLLTGTTDKSGLWIIETLPEGDYTLKELKPADGYADHEDIEFTLAEGDVEAEGDHAGFKFISVTNEKLIRTFKVQKVDQSGNPLAGAVFELQTTDGKAVEGYEQLVSGEDGWIDVKDNLTPGDYRLVEVEAPKGYERLAEPVTFTIDDQQIAQKVLDPIVNELIPGAFLEKYHADNEGNLDRDRPLEGAHFNLYKQDDEGNFQLVKDDKGEAVVYVTDEKGELFSGNLEAGTYQFVEAKAPEGYRLDETPIVFTIPSEDGKPVILEFGNQLLPVLPPVNPEEPEEPGKPGDSSKPGEPNESGTSGTDHNEDNNKPNTGDKLPQTGEEQFLYLFLIGALLAAAGGWTLFSSRRKKA